MHEIRTIDKLRKPGHVNIAPVLSHGWVYYSWAPFAMYRIDTELYDYDLETYLRNSIDAPPIQSLRVDTSPPNRINNIIDSLQIIKQIASGLIYIHDKEEVHGDLKPSNGIIHFYPS